MNANLLKNRISHERSSAALWPMHLNAKANGREWIKEIYTGKNMLNSPKHLQIEAAS